MYLSNTKILLLLLFCWIIFPCKILSQPPLPNHLISVSAIKEMDFGTFCLIGAGAGTLTMDENGNRTSTGTIVPVNINISTLPTPAVFNIKLCQGRMIHLNYAPITLNGNSGGTLQLILKPDKGNDFQIVSDCDFVTQLKVGGTISTSGSAQSPPGTYTGTFYITFNQE